MRKMFSRALMQGGDKSACDKGFSEGVKFESE